MNEEDTGEGQELLKSGINMAGGVAVAVAAGVVSPDLAVSATIGAVGALLPYPADVISRALSKNESRRIKSVEGIAIQEINSRITAGFQPRADGFFDKEINGRSPAGEIFEGVLQIARSEYEEEKLPYLGYLFASIAFDCSVPRGEGNRLIQQLESLSYPKDLHTHGIVAKA
jgi:hypothetical protein